MSVKWIFNKKHRIQLQYCLPKFSYSTFPSCSKSFKQQLHRLYQIFKINHNYYNKLLELELHSYTPPKFSESITELVTFCRKNFSLRSSSNNLESMEKYFMLPDLISLLEVMELLMKFSIWSRKLLLGIEKAGNIVLRYRV